MRFRLPARTTITAAFAACLLLLAACASTAPQYDYAAPSDAAGKHCAATCSGAQNACNQRCGNESEQCRTMTLPGLGGFRIDGSYAAASMGTSGVDAGRGEICSIKLCEAACTREYNKCYAACGGQVFTR